MLPTEALPKALTIGLISAMFCGCAARSKECRITGVTITLIPDDRIDAYCDMVTGNNVNDMGNFVAPGEHTLGCADKDKREIVASDNDKTLRHEVQHLLSWYCGEKAP